MKISKNTLIKIVVITIVLIIIMYNFFNSKDTEEITYSNIIITENESKIENKKEETETIKVYVTGEVKSPGVIKLESGARIEDQTTPNMIQRIIGIFERKPLISKEI